MVSNQPAGGGLSVEGGFVLDRYDVIEVAVELLGGIQVHPQTGVI